MARFFLVVVVFVSSCGDAADRVLLVEDPRLSYLVDALKSRATGRLQVSDLFDDQRFDHAPNPTLLLEKMQRENPDPTADGVNLTVTSLNVALLKGYLFKSPLSVVEAPYVDERTPAVIDSLLDGENGVVFVQELWTNEAQTYAEEAAARLGYQVAGHVSGLGLLTGLYTFVRDDLVQNYIHVDQTDYSGFGADPIALSVSIVRGFQVVSFTHPTIGRVRLYNTHQAPFPHGWSQRLFEQRQIGEAISSEPDDALVLVGGDFNAGPYYARNRWTDATGSDVPDWFENALAYPVGLFFGGLDDLFVRGRTAETAALDVTAGDAVENGWQSAATTPFGVPGWCDLYGAAFSATDCNALYFAQYAGQEAPARLDQLLVRDPTGRVHARNSRIVFDTMRLPSGETIPVSDHGALRVDVTIAPSTVPVIDDRHMRGERQ
jgi:hypothetical protein